MRALVVRGFCIRPQVFAEVGQVVDLPEAFFREMEARGSVQAAPALPARPEPPKVEEAPPADPKPILKSKPLKEH